VLRAAEDRLGTSPELGAILAVAKEGLARFGGPAAAANGGGEQDAALRWFRSDLPCLVPCRNMREVAAEIARLIAAGEVGRGLLVCRVRVPGFVVRDHALVERDRSSHVSNVPCASVGGQDLIVVCVFNFAYDRRRRRRVRPPPRRLYCPARAASSTPTSCCAPNTTRPRAAPSSSRASSARRSASSATRCISAAPRAGPLACTSSRRPAGSPALVRFWGSCGGSCRAWTSTAWPRCFRGPWAAATQQQQLQQQQQPQQQQQEQQQKQQQEEEQQEQQEQQQQQQRRARQ
jgi:hypothetical protein